MNVVCPSCETTFRVDPARIPPAGARARCSRCNAAFHLTREGAARVAPASAPPRAAAPPARAGAPPSGDGSGRSGPRSSPFDADPDTRARRLARALVSDIVVYHGERRQRSLSAGSLRTDFREEILKSWEEYVAQVGTDTAKAHAPLPQRPERHPCGREDALLRRSGRGAPGCPTAFAALPFVIGDSRRGPSARAAPRISDDARRGSDAHGDPGPPCRTDPARRCAGRLPLTSTPSGVG